MINSVFEHHSIITFIQAPLLSPADTHDASPPVAVLPSNAYVQFSALFVVDAEQSAKLAFFATLTSGSRERERERVLCFFLFEYEGTGTGFAILIVLACRK